MNIILDKQYERLALNHKDAFLHNNIEIDTCWGKNVYGITLQVDLSEEIRDSVCRLKTELASIEPTSLLLLPRPYQHISFNQVVFWGGVYPSGNQKTWQSIKDDFLMKFHQLNNKFKSFPISFYRLIAMKSVIAWCAGDENNEMNLLRDTLRQKLPFPPETNKKNSIIHTTIARYKSKLNYPEKVFKYLQSQTQRITMWPHDIILRQENIFPSIDATEIARIKLIN
jgi:hypothetical protein